MQRILKGIECTKRMLLVASSSLCGCWSDCKGEGSLKRKEEEFRNYFTLNFLCLLEKTENWWRGAREHFGRFSSVKPDGAFRVTSGHLPFIVGRSGTERTVDSTLNSCD
jgi:hypothetical protein